MSYIPKTSSDFEENSILGRPRANFADQMYQTNVSRTQNSRKFGTELAMSDEVTRKFSKKTFSSTGNVRRSDYSRKL
ncbi:hypothetical protein CDAR_235691 [Caerostris darwini]|uniref:Uncharacterized protein n=1 Tax=Caerostris darwini TaxID=1538125 RepID=A0AAV4UDG4_9ARAC|nr:hypothetical protein CDAR_235691 [Caerostris darwini]